MNENNENGMESIDLDLEENTVPSDDFAIATAAAASVVEPLAAPDGVGSEIAAPDDLAKVWEEMNTPNEHVTVDSPVVTRRKLRPDQAGLASLKVGIAELEAILQSRGLVDLDDEKIKSLGKEDTRLINLSRALAPIWQDAYYDDIDKKGNWHQTLLHNETKLGAGRVRVENMKDPVLAIRASFGQGSVVQVPLWNTGLWATFRAPTLQELVDFDQQARIEKMNLGRSTNGMSFSNIEVYTVETYVRFALEHVISINYKFETTDSVNELLSVIRNRDYPQLIWGLVMAMYPDGYPFRQPCVANTDKCTHIDELLINFARMGFVDRDKFTPNQALKMASRKTVRDREWLKEYQSEFTFFEKRIQIKDGLTAVLRVPTLQDQITAGHLWVDGITKATNAAFGARLSEMDRYRHIMRSGELTGLRQHSHWIAEFEHQTDEDTAPRIIDDYEKKDKILEMLSEVPELSTKLTEGILSWISESTVSYVGIPKYNCPSCQKEPEDQSHPYLIPIDVSYVFFTLAALKISQVEDAQG